MARSSEVLKLDAEEDDGISKKDRLLIDQYNRVHLIRLELSTLILHAGITAIDGDVASSNLLKLTHGDDQDAKIRDILDDSSDAGSVSEIVSSSIDSMAEMAQEKDSLERIEFALLNQMSEAAKKEIERISLESEEAVRKPRLQSTDCWVKTSRSSKSKRKK